MKKIKILVLTAILVWLSTFVFSETELMAASPSDRRFKDFNITTDNELDSVDIAANQAYVNFSSSITLQYYPADGWLGEIYNNTLQAGSSITETITPGAEIVKLTFPAYINAVWSGADNKIIIQFNGSGNTDMEIPLTEFNVPDTQKTIDLPLGTTSYKIVFPQDTQISNALPLYDTPAALTSQCRITDPTVAEVVSTLKFYLVLDHRLSPSFAEKELTNTFFSPPVTDDHYLNDITGNFFATNQEYNGGPIQNNLLEYPEEETFYMNFSLSAAGASAIMPDYHLLSHTDDGMKLKKLVLKAGLAYLKDRITPTTYDLYVNGELHARDLSSSDTHTFDFDGSKHLDFDISFASGSLLPLYGDNRFPNDTITATYKIDEKSANQINNYLEMKYTVNGTSSSHVSGGSSLVSDFSLRKFISQNEPEKRYYKSTEDITFEFSKFNMEMLPTPDEIYQYLILDNAVDIENYYIKKIELTGIPSANTIQFKYNLSLKNSVGAAFASQEFLRPFPGSDDRRNVTWSNASSETQITKFSLPDMHFGKDLTILTEEDLREYADDPYGLSAYLAGYGLKDYKVKVTYAPIPGRELTTQKVLTHTLNMAVSNTTDPNAPNSVRKVSSSKVKITPAAVNDGKLSITSNVYDSFMNPLYTDDEFLYTLTDIDLGTSTDIRIASTLNNNVFEQELPPGTYKITANDREGYKFLNHKVDSGAAVENKEATITIAENTTTPLTFNNEKQINDGHLIIRQDVTDTSGNPVFTGDVFTYTLKDPNNIETTLNVTSTDGSNSVTTDLKPGTYTVTAKEKDGYHFLNHMINSGAPVKNKTASITITEDGTVTLAFTNQKITKNGLLSIRQNVTDMNGNPTFTGDVFTYTLKDAQGTESALSVTSTDGSNSVTANLKLGTYSVTANEKDGYDYLGYKINSASPLEGSTVSVTVPEDGTVTLDFTYQKKVVVTPPKSDENGSNSTTSGVKKSPPIQTGDSLNAAGMFTLLLCSAATIVVVLRKRRQG